MNEFLKIVLRFIGLLILQIFVMDQINFLGFINPMIYILFITLYPFDNNRLAFLLLAFGYGLILDTFQDTGGAHAAACVTITFLRPVFLRLVYGESYLMKNLRILTSSLDRILLLVLMTTFVHHLTFYSFVIFDVSQILELFKMTLSVGIATVVVGMTILLIMKPKRA